jgi:hypothetical protein
MPLLKWPLVGGADSTEDVGREASHRKGVTQMKFVAMMLVAVFVVAGSMTIAFADCAGHTKAQLVKSDDPQINTDRQANNINNNNAVTAEPEKVAQQTKNVKAEKK